jgi:hypothetical protein
MKNDGVTNSDLFHQRVQANSQASRAFAAMLAQKAFNTRSADAAGAAQGFKTYDFSNISPQDMKSAISRLLKNGRVSFDESTSLVGVIPSPSNTFHQPMNFFTTIQEGIDGALARNEKASAQYLNDALQALIRLQGKPVASS